MKRTLGLVGALFLSALSLASCRKQPAPAPWHQPRPVGAIAPGRFPQIPFGYDPSASGWPGAVGDIVQNAGSTSAWVRNGTADTAWQAFPGSGGGGGGSSGSITVTAPLYKADGGAYTVAPAGEADAGTMSASDKTKLDKIAPNWFSSTLAFIQTKVPSISVTTWQAEMMPNPGGGDVDIAAAAGSAATTLLTTATGGVLQFLTGTTANSNQLIRNKNGGSGSNPQNVITPNMRTGIYALVSRSKITATNATCDIYMNGMSDEAVLTTYFGVHEATSTTNYVLVTTAGHDTGGCLHGERLRRRAQYLRRDQHHDLRRRRDRDRLRPSRRHEPAERPPDERWSRSHGSEQQRDDVTVQLPGRQGSGIRSEARNESARRSLHSSGLSRRVQFA